MVETEHPAPVCRKCANWPVFKEKCWFFWPSKKACSQFKRHSGQDVGFKEDEDHSEYIKLISIGKR